MSDRAAAAGNRHNYFIFNGSDGFPTGKTFTRPPVGTSTNGGMLRFEGAKQANPTVPAPDPTVDTSEDGSRRYEYPFPNNAARTFEIQIAESVLRTAMQVQNMPLKSYAGGQVGYQDIAEVLLPPVGVILQSWMIDAVTGVKKWGGVIIPTGILAYLGRDTFNERTPALFRYSLTPQPSAYENWGYSIIDNDGTPKSATYLPFQDYDYPLMLHAYTGNAVATVFPTDFQPVNVASAMAVTERVNQAIASVQTTTPFGITFTTAPTANGGVGGRGVALYQFRS